MPFHRPLPTEWDRVGTGGSSALRSGWRAISRAWIRAGLLLSPVASLMGAQPALTPAGHFDFDASQVGQEITHAFVWTNQVSSPVPVVRTTTSCDCLKILEAPQRLEPSAVCALIVSVVPTEPGPAFYAAFLEVAEPAQLLMFTVSGTVQGAGNAALSDAASDAVLIGVEELRRRLAASEPPTLVDVRSQGAFVLGHIPGSLNLRLGDLWGRAFLRQVSVVLVSEGHNSQELAAETTRLQQQGAREVRFAAQA